MAHSLDLTSGPIWRQLVKYTVPLVISNILQSMYNIVDMIIAGHFIGPASISAISNAGTIINMITMIIVGLTIGGNILIGQYFGAKNKEGCKDSAATLLSSILILGVAFAGIFYAASRPILAALRAPALDAATQYMKICSIGIIFVAGYNAAAAMLRAVGNSRAPLICIIVTSCVNIVLDAIFVIAFQWGVAGTALATIISQFASFIVAAVIVFRNHEVFGLKLNGLYIKTQTLKKILKLGIPSAIQMSVASISWLSVAYLINSYGIVVSSGNGVSIKIKDFCQQFLNAMMAGASSMVAQNIGAEKFDRARKVVYTAGKIMICIAIVIIVSVEIFAHSLVRLFTSDDATAEAAALNLRVEIIGQVFYAAMYAGHSLMNGSGATWFAFISSFINCILFRIPLAFVLNHFFGIFGVYLACMIAPAASIPFVLWYERSNRWRRSLVKSAGSA
ncbi:MAG: MATE family efflux transporter [Oscillospiraceae bacterium]|jgi:putative MATE family efflux protein|nr:MATE family efflux transporter [Oscillospiraceae bacterium]